MSLKPKNSYIINLFGNAIQIWDLDLPQETLLKLASHQTKFIITCGEEIQVPIPHERIHLSCPSAQDQKIIIEKIFQQDDLLISDEVLKFIANLGINSVRRLEAFINSLHAQSILNHQKINLELTKLTFEKFSSLM
jgi:hypothetical protein